MRTSFYLFVNKCVLKIKISFFLLFVISVNCLKLQAQLSIADTNINVFLKIAKIKVTGNKHTKRYIILREMQFTEGDSIAVTTLQKELTQAKTQVYNTNLFIEVLVDTTHLLFNQIQITVKVKERWYIFPKPQFKLVDRSFNEWYKTFNADFNRVVYGLDFKHNNFSGRRDRLSFTLLNGYARNVSFGYSSPYSNPKLTQGFALAAGYTQNKEVGYKTSPNNLILRYTTKGFVRDNFSFGGAYSWRLGFFKRTGVAFNFDYVKVADSVITSKYNPNYFNKNTSTITYPTFSYGANYVNTDRNAYPLKGLAYSYQITKRGLGFSGGVNSTILNGSVAKFIAHKRKLYSTIIAAAIIKAPFKQAYINQRAIGFGKLNLRGLEVYIVDGVAAVTTNYTLSKKILSFKIPMPFNIKALPNIPITIFAKAYTDFGYSYLPNNFKTRLNNTFLHTTGIGIDLLSFYDIVIKVEYSYNQLGQKGLFLHGGGGY